MGLKTYVCGYLHVQIKSSEPERFLNICNSRSFYMWDIGYSGDTINFYMYANDYESILPILKKTDSRAVLLKKGGLPFLCRKMRNKPVFCIMLLLCAIIWYAGSAFLWNTEYEGNCTITDDQLHTYFEENGIHIGMLKKEIDIEKLEKQLRNRFDLISWVGMKIEGTKLMVAIKENEYAENKDTKDEYSAGENILAPYDGVIKEMVIRSGTPMVNAGDSVSKGDILIAGFVTIEDQSRAVSLQEAVVPSADITIEYEEAVSFAYPATAVRKIYTGREEKGIAIVHAKGMLKSPMRKKFIHADETQIYSQANSLFAITGTNLLLKTCREYYYLEYNPSEEEISENLKEKYEIFHKSLLEKSVQILEKNDNIELYENLWVLEIQLLLQEKMQY